MTDPYRILDIAPTAGMDEIKRAFRARARQSHPDSDPGNPDAEERFKTLVGAYEQAVDAWNRRRAGREQCEPPEPTSPPEPDGSDPTEEACGRSDGSTAGFKVKGTDVTYTLTVTFDEAADGVTHSIDMVTGRKLAVKVPPGTRDGNVLRLRGEGMPGLGGCARGDALVEIKVSAHPVFNQEGPDIHMDVPVTLAEAVVGGRVDVPTVDGSVKVSVPPGSNTGSVLRLRGKGLPRAKGGCGDQYITLRVVLPSSPDDEFIQFVKRWHAEHPYTVR